MSIETAARVVAPPSRRLNGIPFALLLFHLLCVFLVFSGTSLAQANNPQSGGEDHPVVDLGPTTPRVRVAPPYVPPSGSALPHATGAALTSSLMGFDSLSCFEYVDTYYAAGYGSNGSGPGPNYGVTFSSNALVLGDYALNPCGTQYSHVSNEPSPLSSLIFLSGSAATMNVPAGFTGGISFYFTTTTYSGFINIWSGVNATGTLLATLNLPANGGCSYDPYYCQWVPIGINFNGTAKSVDFGGTANHIAFDSISFGSANAVNPQKANGKSPCQCGDPISIGNGNLFEQVTDYQTEGANPLSFTRTYNSLGDTGSYATTLGTKWRSNYDRYLKIASITTVTAERPDGQQINFTLTSGLWVSDTDVDVKLTQSGTTWVLTDHDDTVETYTSNGSTTEAVLQSIKARNGYTQTLARNSSQVLLSVTDSYSRVLSFTYSGSGLLQTVTTPDALVLSYAYTVKGALNVLSSVSYSTSPVTTLTYLYESSSLPTFLTGITDENGARFTTWTYDATGRALTSLHANGADLTTVSYNDSDGSRKVTNALGVADTYLFTTLQGVPKVSKITRAATSTTAAAVETFTYDTNGYLSGTTDWNGNVTTYTNDAHGQPTSVIEGFGTSVARTTTFVYHPTFHLPTSIATASLTTTLTYDATGNLLTRTLTDMTTTTVPYVTKNTARTTTYTYSNYLLASVKRPRTDLNATTTFAYDASGSLTGIANALNQKISVTKHTGGGKPQTIVDTNGVTTQLVYNPRLRLLSSTVTTAAGPLKTAYTYDAAGNLTMVTQPDSSALTNTYDNAHRLTKVIDSLGNSSAYTLDALGDRTQTSVSNSGGTLTWQRSTTFDALGRPLVNTGGAGQTITQAYDPNGNVLSTTDGLSHKTTSTYDALNRLSTSTDANGGTTTPAYDAYDRILALTDANGNLTSYVRDGFGGVIQQTSPDSGVSVFHYDGDGNMTSKTDALGVVTTQTFDALDRTSTTTYPAHTAENVAYTYDQTTGFTFGVGRLTSVSDAAGTLTRQYDERGNLLTEARVNGMATLSTAYAYDGAGRVSGMTYPDGTLVTYTRDAAGYLATVSAKPAGSATTTKLATLSHQPFGPIAGMTYGNGIAETWTFDKAYRPTNITDLLTAQSLQNLTYSYDNVDNVKSITDALNAANSQTLGYDLVNRLTSATSGAAGYGAYSWTYDKVGNRLTQVQGANTTTYGYTPGSNRLAKILLNQPHATVHLPRLPKGRALQIPETVAAARSETPAPVTRPAPQQRTEMAGLLGWSMLVVGFTGAFALRRRMLRNRLLGTMVLLLMVAGSGTFFVGCSKGSAPSTSTTPTTSTAATPTFAPASGTYTATQTVTITDTTSGATIFYTTDGSSPTAASTKYTVPLTVATNQTVQAIAVATGYTNSLIGSATYVINAPTAAMPTIAPSAGTYTTVQTVTLSDTTAGATIYYTTDGSIPTSSSSRYTAPIPVANTQTVQAIAIAYGFSPSPVASAAYVIALPATAAPTVSPAAGTYTTVQTVTLADTTAGAAIYYTTDGSTPTSSSTRYVGAITVGGTTTLKAVALASGYSASSVTTAVYTLTLPAATPTFSPAPGSFDAPQVVKLADTTAGATIYLTTDGSSPTMASTKYTAPITLSSTTTLNAIAIAPGSSASAVATGLFTIGVESVLTDANGNITSLAPDSSSVNATYAYNNAGRLASVTGSPTAATFVYDYTGQRFSKTDSGSSPTTFSYAQGGTLIAENDNGTVTDYIYADGRPIAVLQPTATPAANQIAYVTADRLGTPQLMTNTAGSPVWSTTYQPFGVTGTITAAVNQNLRFPGQVADAETGFNYNLNRDYIPSLGRYLQSDPIGIAGGTNPFLYVEANPAAGIDPLGLFDVVLSGNAHVPISPGFAIGGSVGITLYSNNAANILQTHADGEAEIGTIADAGLSLGLSDLSGTGGKCASEVTLSAGIGKFGISITPRVAQDTSLWIINPLRYIDGFSFNFGVSLGLPVTVTLPLSSKKD
jgi:RHS repeat-associated protein